MEKEMKDLEEAIYSGRQRGRQKAIAAAFERLKVEYRRLPFWRRALRIYPLEHVEDGE